MVYLPNRYPLRQVIHWQSPHGLAPVTGQPSDGNGEPNLWPFPSSLSERLRTGPVPDASGNAVLEGASALKFALAVGHQDKPNAPPVFTPVNAFAWATLVEIGVKRVMAGSAGNVAVKNDYLISGADSANRDLLYRLWTHMADPSYADTATIHILSKADPASQSSRGVISQDLAAADTAVIKTNLSTTTKPGRVPGAPARGGGRPRAAHVRRHDRQPEGLPAPDLGMRDRQLRRLLPQLHRSRHAGRAARRSVRHPGRGGDSTAGDLRLAAAHRRHPREPAADAQGLELRGCSATASISTMPSCWSRRRNYARRRGARASATCGRRWALPRCAISSRSTSRSRYCCKRAS